MNKIIEMYLGSATPANAEEAALLELFSRFVTTIGRFPTRREMATAAVRRGAQLLDILDTVTRTSLRLLKERERAAFTVYCGTWGRYTLLSEKGQKIADEGLALTDPEAFWPTGVSGSYLQLLRDEVIAMRDSRPQLSKMLLDELNNLVTDRSNRRDRIEEIHSNLVAAIMASACRATTRTLS